MNRLPSAVGVENSTFTRGELLLAHKERVRRTNNEVINEKEVINDDIYIENR